MRRPLDTAAARTLTLCALACLFLGCTYATAAPGPGPRGPDRDRAWPVAGTTDPRPLVARAWEPPPAPWAAGHRGVDLTAPPGQPVRAAAPGTVSFAGTVAGRGVISIELTGTGDPPLRTTYEPVRATARPGDRVAAGDVIGVLEASRTHCTGGCLHWGLRRGDTYLDPLSLLPPWMLRRGPSRLLPLSGPLGGYALPAASAAVGRATGGEG
ncbi:M23 family metallopeptidase [Streptomyces sp. NPDC053048]|uniref:M23 family metallopeptidase n=1 Tax=Streptomyces sp. NPDC053048 TaxID=3365694 RepID=UPI0037D80962